MEAGSRLGCRASELEVGDEFSMDEGRSWHVVVSSPRYLSDDVDCLTLRFLASPGGGPPEEVSVEDSFRVLLDRAWGRTGPHPGGE